MLQSEIKSAFVTGATGFIGQHLVNALLIQNWNVTILTRNPKTVPENWISRIKIVAGNLNDFDNSTLNSQTVVFHLAGEIKDKTKFQKTNELGTKTLLINCEKANVKNFIHLSSVGVMGARKKGVVDETLICQPRNEYEKSKLKAEDLVINSKVDFVILRPSIIYGPGKKIASDTFLALIKSIKSGLFSTIGENKSFYNIVHVQDVVNALIYLTKKRTNEIYIINDPIEWRIFHQEIKQLLDLKTKIRSIPKFLALIAGVVGELAKVFKIRFPFNLTRYKTLTCSTIFSAKKLKKQTQFKFIFNTQTGLENIIDYYQDHELI